MFFTINLFFSSSYYRGAKQKTVAFSFYGNPESIQVKERKYFEGIKANLKAMPKIYPDWTLRLYYDLPNGHYLMQDLCDLACNDSNIGKYVYIVGVFDLNIYYTIKMQET